MTVAGPHANSPRLKLSSDTSVPSSAPAIGCIAPSDTVTVNQSTAVVEPAPGTAALSAHHGPVSFPVAHNHVELLPERLKSVR